jgi:NAD(P)-dependent dehydrogenase (short-subunit alcohol dehydrogenase family)
MALTQMPACVFSKPIWQTKPQPKRYLPQVIKQMGAVSAVVNSAALFEHDDVQTFSYANMAAHWASNTGAAIVLAQALHQHCQDRQAPAAEAVVINMLDQKLWNPNPDFLSYTLSKAALEAANTLLAQALAPQVRVVGVAPGLTLTSHMLADDKFEGAAQAQSAWPIFFGGRCGQHGGLCHAQPRHHRYHFVGRWRSALDEIRARLFFDVITP